MTKQKYNEIESRLPTLRHSTEKTQAFSSISYSIKLNQTTMIGKNNIKVRRNVMKTSNHKYDISTYSYPQLRIKIITIDAPKKQFFNFKRTKKTYFLQIQMTQHTFFAIVKFHLIRFSHCRE